jgi:hypothetical protein
MVACKEQILLTGRLAGSGCTRELGLIIILSCP